MGRGMLFFLLPTAASWATAVRGEYSGGSCSMVAAGLLVDGAPAPPPCGTHGQCALLPVDSAQPLLSWRLDSTAAGALDQRQSAYRIQVATAADFSAVALLWDSGRVASAQSLQVPYGGPPLPSELALYLRVQVWDEHGAACGWSAAAQFETTLAAADWAPSAWLARRQPQPPASECDPYRDDPFSAPRFRAPLPSLSGCEVAKARVYATGLGYYRLWVDGERVSDRELEPAQTNYTTRVLYTVYNVTEQLRRPGQHVVGVEVGNGWWNPLPLLFWGSRNLRAELPTGEPMFRIVLRVHCAPQGGGEGRVITVSSNAAGGWQAGPGPTLFNNIYLGERYDARLETPGWAAAGFDASGWAPAVELAGPGVGALELQRVPPVRRRDPLQARQLSATTTANGTVLILDAGKNHAGACTFRLHGPAGSVVSMRYGELLHADGTLNPLTSVAGQIKGPNPSAPCQPAVAWQADRLTLGENQPTEWSPAWSWHGFRFIELTLPAGVAPPAAGDVTCQPMLSDVPSASTFESSDPMLGRLRELNRNTFASNLMSVQSDCPHRERLGYGGDALGTGEAGMTIFDLSLFYAKRAQDFADSQRANGGFTETAPFVGIDSGGLGDGSGPIGWETVQPATLLWLYRYYGDVASVRRGFNASLRYVQLLDQRPPGIESGLGDWMPVEGTDVRITGLGFLRESFLAFANISAIVGRSDLAAEYRGKAAAVRGEINSRFLDNATGVYRVPAAERGAVTLPRGSRFAAGPNGTQTGQGMALFMGIVPNSLRGAALRAVAGNARAASDVPGGGQGPAKGGPGPHMLAGLFGIKWFLMALADGGEQDLAYEVLTTTSYPSYGWMMSNPYANATTIWEAWFFSDNTYSHNHPMFASSEVWMTQALAGIQPHPEARGMDRVLVRPRPPPLMAQRAPGGVAWVRAGVVTPRGNISVSWKLTRAGNFSLSVDIPPNVQADVMMPGQPQFSVGSGRRSFAAAL